MRLEPSSFYAVGNHESLATKQEVPSKLPQVMERFVSWKDERTIVVSKDDSENESSEDLERGEQINLEEFDLIKLDLLT